MTDNSLTEARDVGRAASTLSREIDRNGGRHRYRALDADARAWQYARRPKRCRLAISAPLRVAVAAKLRKNWSPAQIGYHLTPHWQVFLRSENLFDRTVPTGRSDVTAIGAPRLVHGGVRLTF